MGVIGGLHLVTLHLVTRAVMSVACHISEQLHP